MKTRIAGLNERADAGNPHVRFDEGEVASYPPTVGRPEGVATRGAELRRGLLLCKNSVLRWMACLVVSAIMPYLGSAADTITKSGTYYYTLCPNTTSTSMQYTYGSAKIVVPSGSTVKVWTSKDMMGGSNYAGGSGADIDCDGVGTVFNKDCEIEYNVHLKSTKGWNATYEVKFKIQVVYTSNLSLDRQGGSGGSSSVKVSEGDSMPSITVPSRSGYKFKGYYSSKNGQGTQYYSEAGASARKWDRVDSITLYAYWVSTVTYTVTYKPGSYGAGAEQTAQKQQGVGLSLKGALFTRNGYTQTGWSNNANGSTKDYELNGSYTTDAAATLYPYWFKNISYSITYDLDGGTHGMTHPTSATYGTPFKVSAPSRSG